MNEKFDNPIDKDKVAENPGLLPYAHTVSGVVIKPEDMGKTKATALKAMEQQTDMQLSQLQQQMSLIMQQAQAIKDRTDISAQIYDASMGFSPIIGHVYYLYEKESGEAVLSMVSPDEWGRSRKFKRYVACVRLLADHTWDIIEKGETQ